MSTSAVPEKFGLLRARLQNRWRLIAPGDRNRLQLTKKSSTPSTIALVGMLGLAEKNAHLKQRPDCRRNEKYRRLSKAESQQKQSLPTKPHFGSMYGTCDHFRCEF
jgi:hypothetical protein